MNKKILDTITNNVKIYFDKHSETFIPGKSKIPLQVPSYGAAEVNEAIESLLSTWVTMGKKVKQFETMFANYIGTKYALMLNSGSSANLIALSILTNKKFSNFIKPKSEIITPTITWATTVFPMNHANLIPKLVDVDLDTFNINIEGIEKAITKKTRAIMPVHLLGNPVNMEKIMEIARKYDLYVIEDCCEAHGAEINRSKVGSFGDISTFSFFISHHITTIEGGMLLTNNEEIYELAKSLRAFGWIRDSKNKKSISKKYPGIDERFLFNNIGYNFRPTEIQGAFGIHQLKKLEKFIKIRRRNAAYWNKRLKKHNSSLILQRDFSNTRHVWFSYPITVRPHASFSREKLMVFLEKNGIETRPIQAGDITQQPALKLITYKTQGTLNNAKFIHDNSFFIGNHQNITSEQRRYIADVIDEFMDENST